MNRLFSSLVKYYCNGEQLDDKSAQDVPAGIKTLFMNNLRIRLRFACFLSF